MLKSRVLSALLWLILLQIWPFLPVCAVTVAAAVVAFFVLSSMDTKLPDVNRMTDVA